MDTLKPEPFDPDEYELEKQKEQLVHNLKTEINEFLFSRIPPETTIKEFDRLAMQIHDAIWEVWGEI